jgi:hypothetical protein
MKYTVVWKRPAKRRLAEIWMGSADRAAVTRAADEIDARLASAPLAEGESREEEFRVLFMAPLAVKYSVSPADSSPSLASGSCSARASGFAASAVTVC